VKFRLDDVRERVITLPTKYDNLTSMEKAEVRGRYVELQEGRCWYCRRPLRSKPPKDILQKVKAIPRDVTPFPRGFFKHRVHLHHNHTTGLTIGATHAQCNAVLWVYYGE
jgi:hypothetical protein